MKKLTKILALLLAGLLSVSALMSCTGQGFGTADDEEDEDESSDFSDYEDLTPREVYQKLQDADQVKIQLEYFNGSESSITKDGKKVKHDPNGTVTYYDYQNQLHYIPNQDGSYSTEALSYDWEETLATELDHGFLVSQNLDFFFVDSYYEDEDDDVYKVSSDSLEEFFDTDEVEVEASMERDGTTYTFTCEVDDGDEKKTAECKIKFDDFSVKLPDANSDTTTNGEAVERPTPGTQENPIATERPDEPDAPVEDDNLVAIPDGMMAPNDLYALLYDAEDATIDISADSNGITYYYSFEKDGDIIAATRYTSEDYIRETVYFDNANARRYYKDNGVWYYNAATISWEEEVLEELNGLIYNLYTIANDEYEYDKELDRIVLKEALSDDMGITVTFTHKPANDSYVLTAIDSDWNSTTSNVKLSVFSAIALPTAQPAPDDTPDVGATDYAGLAPSQLYDAITNAEDISITVLGGSSDVYYIKDGDYLYIQADGTSAYIDFSTGLGYAQQGNQWVCDNSAYTNWQETLNAMQISSSSYIFIDDYYDSISASDSELTIRSSLLVGSELSYSALLREGNTYTLVETYNNGTTLYTSFCFDPTTVELPM